MSSLYRLRHTYMYMAIDIHMRSVMVETDIINQEIGHQHKFNRYN